MKMLPRSSTALCLAAALALASCASVSVYKLNAAGKIEPDTPEGLRFYLPRPYVSVFEPFIVASEAYLTRGEISPDGNYVLLTQVPTGLHALANQDLAGGLQRSMGGLRIDSSQVRLAERDTGTPQAASAAASAVAPAASAASSAEAKKPEIAGGVLNYKATNDNSAYAVTPQPRYFNVLWLPDFDEQYVVSAKAGLGNAGVVLGFGQGWSLQSLEATVDNSALAKPLLDFYAGTLGSLQKLATAKIEAPLAALTGGSPQAAAVDANGKPAATAASFAGGTPVTVKVTKVRVVAPGLYPVLKPKEAQGQVLSSDQAKRILAPAPPFTNIAFNTYDVIVVEAARTTGDSAVRIHQYVESTTTPSAAGQGKTTDSPTDVVGSDGAMRELRRTLSKPENATAAKEYFVPVLTSDAGGTKTVTLSKTTGGPIGTRAALPDDQTLKDLTVATMKAAGVTVLPDNVIVKR